MNEALEELVKEHENVKFVKVGWMASCQDDLTLTICCHREMNRIPTSHYLLYISFSSGTFSEVHVSGQPLPYYYNVTVDLNKSVAPGCGGHTPVKEAQKKLASMGEYCDVGDIL